MLYLKSCPKCRGDMYLDRDAYGSFLECLQCGLMQDLVEKGPVRAIAAVQPHQAKRVAGGAVATPTAA